MIKSYDDKSTLFHSQQSSTSRLIVSSCSDIASLFFSISWKPRYSEPSKLFSKELCRLLNVKNWAWESDNAMRRLTEVYGELQLLLNILSVRFANVTVVRVGLAICGRRKEEYIQGNFKCYCLYILVDWQEHFCAKRMFYFPEKVFLNGLPGSHY